MRYALGLALAGWFVSVALAQQQTNVLAPYRLAAWHSDGRLAKRITADIPGKPLRETLAQLSRASGAALRVTRECAEWRAVLHVRETALAEVLAGLAYAFDLSWRRYSPGEGKPPGYELYQSPTQKQAQDDLLWGRAQRLQEVLVQALSRARQLAEQGTRLDIPALSFPTTRQQAIERCVYELLQNPQLIPAVSPLEPSELARLFTGYPVYLPAERFTPAERQTLAPEHATVYVVESPDKEPQPKQVSQRLEGVFWEFGATLNLLMGIIISRDQEGRLSTTRLELKLLDYGPSTAFLQEDVEDRAVAGALTPQERQQRLSLEEMPAARSLSVPERLRRLAQVLPVNVIAEYYPLGMTGGMMPTGETAGQALEVLLPYYRPKRAGTLLLLRSRHATLDRLGDVPQHLLDRWLGTSQDFGLNLHTVREIDATLTIYQREAFSEWCSDRRAAVARFSPARSVFLDRMSEATRGEGRLLVRLLSVLPVGQQEQVLAGARVLLPASPVVQETLAELRLQRLRWGGSWELPPDAPLWIQGKRSTRRFWAYNGAALDVEYYVHPENLWQSAQGESLSAFQKRLRQTHPNLDESRWLEVEEEQVTLWLGAGEQVQVETLLSLPRFRRLPAAGRQEQRQ